MRKVSRISALVLAFALVFSVMLVHTDKASASSAHFTFSGKSTILHSLPAGSPWTLDGVITANPGTDMVAVRVYLAKLTGTVYSQAYVTYYQMGSTKRYDLRNLNPYIRYDLLPAGYSYALVIQATTSTGITETVYYEWFNVFKPTPPKGLW